MKQFVPNLITIGNLLSGCMAAVFAFNDQLILAIIFMAIGIFFDFFDGLAARVLNVSSELGKQLDSLADMVTSGVVPGIVMCQMLAKATGYGSVLNVLNHDVDWAGPTTLFPEVIYIGFFITAASAYRLANFNIDTRQSDSFIGVPTPANALLIVSLGVISQTSEVEGAYEFLFNTYVLLFITLLSCYLLNANLPLFALKFKNWSFKGNEIRYIFLLISIVLLAVLQFVGLPIIIVLYILISVGNNVLIKK